MHLEPGCQLVTHSKVDIPATLVTMNLTLTLGVKVIWRKCHLSHLILHLESRYQLVTSSKMDILVTFVTMNLTLTLGVKVIWRKYHLFCLIIAFRTLLYTCIKQNDCMHIVHVVWYIIFTGQLGTSLWTVVIVLGPLSCDYISR